MEDLIRRIHIQKTYVGLMENYGTYTGDLKGPVEDINKTNGILSKLIEDPWKILE